MRTFEGIFNLAKEEDIGKPMTTAEESDTTRIDLKKLGELYNESVTFNCINILTHIIMSPGYTLTNTNLDEFLNEVGNIGNPTTWFEMMDSIYRFAFIYGQAWIELIYGNGGKQIVDLVSVNPESMDYAKNNMGKIAVDKYSRPLGYVQKLPMGVAAPANQKLPDGVKVSGDEIFIPPTNMAHIKLYTLGDGLRPYGLIEPGYRATQRRLMLEDSYAVALDKSFPIRVAVYGDQMHRPTPEKMENALNLVSNLRGKNDSVALPYYMDIKMLESKGIENLIKPLDYFLSLSIAAYGLPKSFAIGMGEACYSEDTKTLTENGFKYHWEISDTEKIATYNPETEKLEYHLPTHKELHYYNGKMHHYKNSVIDIMVTPEHKMYYKTMNSNKWNKEKSKDITTSFIKFKNKVDFEGIEQDIFTLKEIPYAKQSNIKNNDSDYKINMDDWLEFLGYFVSEGYTRIHGGSFRVEISQVDKTNLSKIKACLDKLPFDYCENYGHGRLEGYRISNKSLAIYLYENCGVDSASRVIPKEYLNLSKRQLNILFDALILGDGNFFGTTGKSYATCSNILNNNMLELFIKLGYSTSTYKHLNMYRISGNLKHYEPRIKLKEQRTEEDYDGMVYCYEVPNHLFITEHGGKVAIQGNTNRSTLNVQRDLISKIEMHINTITKQIENKIFKPVAATNNIKLYPTFVWNDLQLKVDKEPSDVLDTKTIENSEKPVKIQPELPAKPKTYVFEQLANNKTRVVENE